MKNGDSVEVIMTAEYDENLGIKQGDVGTVIETVDQDGETLYLVQFDGLSVYMWPCQLQKVV